MPDYINITPEEIGAQRAEEARRVTQGYEIRELQAMPTGALRRLELENRKLRAACEDAEDWISGLDEWGHYEARRYGHKREILARLDTALRAVGAQEGGK